MKVLTQAQVDAFRRDGFLFPVAALTPDEVATCLAGLQRLETELGSPVADADVKWRSHGYAHSPWFNDLIRHPRILDAIEDVIGPDILVWTSTFFIKEPHSPTFAAWHQDGTYFGLEPQEQVCAWVALTDATAEVVCMEMLSSDPLGGWICGHIGPDEPSPLQTQDDQPVQKLEPDGRNDEQIDGCDVGSVTAQEDPPARRGRSVTPRHVLGDG